MPCMGPTQVQTLAPLTISEALLEMTPNCKARNKSDAGPLPPQNRKAYIEYLLCDRIFEDGKNRHDWLSDLDCVHLEEMSLEKKRNSETGQIDSTAIRCCLAPKPARSDF